MPAIVDFRSQLSRFFRSFDPSRMNSNLLALERFMYGVTSPGNAWPVPFVIGTDPDPASSAVLRVGGAVLASAALQTKAVDSGTFTRSADRGSYEGNAVRFAIPVTDESNAGSILYRVFDTTALVIVGAGTTGSGRRVRIYDTLSVNTVALTGVDLAVGTGGVVIGADPGGVALLRVAGQITSRNWQYLNNTSALGGANGDGRSALVFGVSDTVEGFFLGATSNTTRASTVLGLFSWQLNNWVQRWNPDGTTIIGITDPGNSEVLRVGGGARVGGVLTLSGTTVEQDYWRSDGGTDSKFWNWFPQPTAFDGRILNDARSTGVNWLHVVRSGMTVTSVGFPNGSVIIGTDPGGSDLLRVGGHLLVGSAGGSRLKFSTTASDPALRIGGSPLALESVTVDNSAYHAFRAATIYATTGFSGDGSALTNLPASTPLNNQRVANISNTVKLTYSLPAGKLGTDGNALRIATRINKAVTAAGLNAVMKFGATTLCTITFGTTAETPEVEIIIRRTGATAQIAFARQTKSAGNTAVTRTTPAETLSGAITLSWESSTTETFDVDHWTVELIP